MLTFLSRRKKNHCDGVSRRDFIKAGALGIGSLSLADLLRLEAEAGVQSSNKGIINIYLSGGPPHQDMFDMKPDAPAEFRGEFNPISTNVPGTQISELYPKLAQVTDKYTIIRSIVGAAGQHSPYQTLTGFGEQRVNPFGGKPAMGSIVSKLLGSSGAAPPFVSMHGKLPHGFLGPAHTAHEFTTDDLESGSNEDLVLSHVTAGRMRDRLSLLKRMDNIRRDLDQSGAMEAMDGFTQRAVDMVASGKVADALDLSKEDPAVRKLYGYVDMGIYGHHQNNEHFLTAKRLIQAGVRVVSVKWNGWDTHERNFRKLKHYSPVLDSGLSGLLTDLYQSGLDKDITVIVWGEFGRSPKINDKAGRDHWPRVMQAIVAGGGMNVGQVIGSTDRLGGEAVDRPVHVREIFATLYKNLGIDAKNTFLTDPSGKRHYLVDGRNPVKELG